MGSTYRIIAGKLKWKIPAGKPWDRWMDLLETECEDVNCIQLA
jgi:hypothetical protein